ncbi:MAG TPA: DMT family transporter [Candidatus Limnocylindria bacterium]|nr:DMT family transporter [Candidatus Limnocylindria bacterium]
MEPGVLFGLAAAASFGSGDFTGGFASRRVAGLTVVAVAQGVGLLLLLGIVAVARPPMPEPGSLMLAGLAGAFGGIGLLALYRGLAMGSMGIVTGLSGVGSVALPLLVGWAIGRSAVGPLQWIGVLVAMAAIGAASGATRMGIRPQAVLHGLAAALFFGLWFVLLDLAAGEERTWILVASRGSATVLMGALALGRHQYAGVGAAWPLMLLAGSLDVAGNAAFVESRATIPVGVAAALSGLYPVVTMLLARSVLREALPPLGVVAVLLAVAGVVLISLG